ncbi:MAG: tyrosine-type recombinase/integrase [Pyrobaculum sp.]|jgi:integrase
MVKTNMEEVRRVYLSLDTYRDAMERLYKLAYQKPERRRVLTYLLGATGRRISETLELTTRDVDFERRQITWRILKKGRPDHYATLPMSQKVEDVLRRYIVLNGVADKLFPISRQQAWIDVKKTFKEVGLHGWRPHDLRHAFILEALLNSKSIEQVRRWTQHSSYRELLEYARVVGLEIDKPVVPW